MSRSKGLLHSLTKKTLSLTYSMTTRYYSLVAYYCFSSFLTTTTTAAATGSLSTRFTKNVFSARANVLTDVLASCQFDPLIGLFNDLVWQSGSGLETLSDVISQSGTTGPSRWTSVLSIMYSKLPAVIDNCFDDHQWFLLGWARAYEATGNTSYLERAATIFDFVSNNGWETTVCKGGWRSFRLYSRS